MGRARRTIPRIINTPEGPRDRTRMAGEVMERDQRRRRGVFSPTMERVVRDRDRVVRDRDRDMETRREERREERRQRREERGQTFGDSFREQRREERRDSDRPRRAFGPIRTRPRPVGPGERPITRPVGPGERPRPTDPRRDKGPDRSIMPIDPGGRRNPRTDKPNASIMPIDPRGSRGPRPERSRRRDQNIAKTDI